MKKVIFLLALLGFVNIIHAQNNELTGRWMIGVNFKAGKMKEKISRRSVGLIFPQTVNYTESALKIENDNPVGFDIQLGYYFSPKKDWGISTGVVYYKNESRYTMDSLHFEYRSTDFNNDVFRQVITNNGPIRETFSNTVMSIPLLLNYRTMIAKWIGFSIAGGPVCNLKIESTYTSTANFDYEAIYKFENVNGHPEFVYDPSRVPHRSDWLITEEKYMRDKGDGNQVAYFKTLQEQGYNVGLNEETKAKTDRINHEKGSIGLLIQPSFNVKISRNFFLNIGGYYMYQGFRNNEADKGMMIVDKRGAYQSLLTNTIRRHHNYYGLNLGLSFHF